MKPKSARLRDQRLSRTRLARLATLEHLEDRRLLTGSYTYSIVNGVGTATSDGSAGTLYIAEVAGLIKHSEDGVNFDWNWNTGGTTTTLAASSTSTVNVVATSNGNLHSVILGATIEGTAASDIQATINIQDGGTANSLTIDESESTAAATYQVNNTAGAGSITGPTGLQVHINGSALQAGITLKGSSGADTFNVVSTRASEPVFLSAGNAANTFNVKATTGDLTINGGGGANTVNVGDATNSTASVKGSLSVNDYDGPGSTTLNVNAQGMTTGQTVSVDKDSITGMAPGTISYDLYDIGSKIVLNGGTGGNTFTTGGASAPLTINTGAATGITGNTVNVHTASHKVTINDQAVDTVTLGSEGSVFGITDAVTLSGTASDLTLDNSGGGTDEWVIATGSVTGDSWDGSAKFGALKSLVFKGNNTGNRYDVNGLPGDTTIHTGYGEGGSNTVNVHSTPATAKLSLDDQGDDVVTIGHDGKLSDVLGAVSLDTRAAMLKFDGSTETTNFSNAVLSTDGEGTATVTGLTPGTVSYDINELAGMKVAIGSTGTLTFNVSFDNANPLPSDTGTDGNKGLDLSSGVNYGTLNLYGSNKTTADNSETYTPDSYPVGKIEFSSQPTITFEQFKAINDVAKVGSYTFELTDAHGDAVSLGDGDTFKDAATLKISNLGTELGGTFTPAQVGNKPYIYAHVNTGSHRDQQVEVDNSTRPAALNRLYVQTGLGNDVVGVLNTSTGLTVETDNGNDVLNVRAAGLAPDSKLYADLGPGNNNVINVDASHTYIDDSDDSSYIDFARPDPDNYDNTLYSDIEYSYANAVNVQHMEDAPLRSYGTTLDAVVNTPLTNAVVASFHDYDRGSRASEFTATIDWGDGTASTGGIVVADMGGNYSVYGSHTYTSAGDNGQFPITVKVQDLGSSWSGTYGNVTLSTSDDGGSNVQIDSTANLVLAAPVLTPFPDAGSATEGQVNFQVPVASFTYRDNSAPASAFSATIDWGDGTPPSAGLIASQPVQDAPYVVRGSHTYANPIDSMVPVIVTVTDATGNKTTTVMTLFGVQDAALIALGTLPASGVEGQAMTAVPLGSFLDNNPGATVGQFSVSIEWGDGTSSPGTVVLTGAGPEGPGVLFNVLGTHTYARAGQYAPVLHVHDVGGNAITIQDNAPVASVKVAAAPLAIVGMPVTGTEGLGIGHMPVATFTSADPAATPEDFTASVNWGDGSTSENVMVSAIGVPNGVTFGVFAPHVYARPGTYAVAVTVDSVGGAMTGTVSHAVIADAGLSASPASAFSPIEGAKFSSPVATFTDANPIATVDGFTATIDWGDGTPTTAGLISQPDGPGTAFVVSGTHAYADPTGANVPVTVTITDFDGAHARAVMAVAGVADASLLNAALLPAVAVEGQALTAAPLASFVDADRNARVSDYTVSIDWGDGSEPTAGTVVLTGGNALGVGFNVLGTHTYAAAGRYAPVIMVTDSGGQSFTLNGDEVLSKTVTVAASPLTPAGAALTAVEGLTLDSPLVASFASANPAAVASDFNATINWGDGSAPVAATPVKVGGVANGVSFQVPGTHTYAKAGTYAVQVVVTSAGGARSVAVGQVVVADAALSATEAQVPVVTPERTTYQGTAAYFLDANPMAPASDFKATIDWGDGSPWTAGTVTKADGLFTVTGAHAYADSGVNGGVGSFPVTVYVTDASGSTLTLSNTAKVADDAIDLGGILDPSSDTGASHTDGVTNNSRPTYFGHSEPGSTVKVYATDAHGVTSLIALATTNPSGVWAATPGVPMADGTYDVHADALDASGKTFATARLATVTGEPTLVIDTASPKITGATFDRVHGTVMITFADDRSGMDTASLTDANNYRLYRNGQAFPGEYLVSSLNAPAGNPAGSVTVPVEINGGRMMRAGRYLFTASAGITDMAGNALSGTYYGTFPTGNRNKGGSFVATVDAGQQVTSAPQSVIGSARPVHTSGVRQNAVHATGSRVATQAPAVTASALTHHDEALAHVQVSRRRHR